MVPYEGKGTINTNCPEEGTFKSRWTICTVTGLCFGVIQRAQASLLWWHLYWQPCAQNSEGINTFTHHGWIWSLLAGNEYYHALQLGPRASKGEMSSISTTGRVCHQDFLESLHSFCSVSLCVWQQQLFNRGATERLWQVEHINCKTIPLQIAIFQQNLLSWISTEMHFHALQFCQKCTWLRTIWCHSSEDIVGLGFLGEQGAESIHARFNSIKRNYSSMPNSVQRLECVMVEHFRQICPHNIVRMPLPKPKPRKKKTPSTNWRNIPIHIML